MKVADPFAIEFGLTYTVSYEAEDSTSPIVVTSVIVWISGGSIFGCLVRKQAGPFGYY